MSRLRIGSQLYEGLVRSAAQGLEITIGSETVSFAPVAAGIFRATVADRNIIVAIAKLKDRWLVEIDSHLIEVFDAASESRRKGQGDGQAGKITAPMPGKIVKLLASVGENVSARQQLMIVEAMKMENPVVAPVAGIVRAINVAVGDQVDTEKILVDVEPSA